ncbi:hypothetical protein MycrhDRAFT_4397 [Mycolicibacterium rhodesiae JS60]|nr:hypothetical protein MycrhDRAFT_4397 [Mycolicibacterium rhodesiae JS60]
MEIWGQYHRRMERLRNRSAVAALVLTVGVFGMTTACGNKEKEAPSSTTTSTTTPASSSVAPPPAPTEKGSDGGGPNSFSPTVKAPPAPTAIPGDN